MAIVVVPADDTVTLPLAGDIKLGQDTIKVITENSMLIMLTDYHMVNSWKGHLHLQNR